MIFVKFGQKENIEQLQKEGLIYMNTFEHFRNCEDKERKDKNENSHFLGQAGQCTIKIDGHKFTKEDGFINIIINAPHLNQPYLTHLYCMSCIQKEDNIREDWKIFDDKVKDFGDTLLVILNQKIFMERLEFALRQTCEKNLTEYWQGKKVEYVDFETYHGDIGPFIKDISFNHQQEWRLGVRVINCENPFSFKIGSIEDISIIIPISKFKNKIKKQSGNNLEICF